MNISEIMESLCVECEKHNLNPHHTTDVKLLEIARLSAWRLRQLVNGHWPMPNHDPAPGG